MDKRPPDTKEPTETPIRGEDPCKSLRLAIVVGSRSDKAIDTAIDWLRNRARALGGEFHLWLDTTNSDPLGAFRDYNITDGRNLSRSRRYSLPNGSINDDRLEKLLEDSQPCRGRIEELVIIHHGKPVEEAALADNIAKIFQAIRVPVCKVVWWSCNAAVDLDVEEGGATDVMMRILGSSNIAQCEPCGCSGPIELIWPTAGKAYITGAGRDDQLQTNDGKVHRLKWGYRQPDGSLGLNPPPGEDHSLRRPPHREPPYGQNPPKDDGTVLGKNVGDH